MAAEAAGSAGTLPEVAPGAGVLAEVSGVHWRPRVDGRRLRDRGRLWTLTTVAHVVPFIGVAGVLLWLEPLSFPVALMCAAHAWIIPELYAQRGANVVRVRRPVKNAEAEARSVGLLGDLVGHEAREVHARTGLVPEPGVLGTWIVGEAGALLMRGRRVFCWCVRVDSTAANACGGARDLPSGDRIAHLLLALRTDEQGFATVANLAFSGAPWRVRRRLPREMRAALDRRGP